MKTIRFGFWAALACAALTASADSVFGQGVVTQWRFNSNPPDSNTTTGTLSPNVGSGIVTTVGGTTTSFAGGLTDAGSTDTSASGDNSELSVSTFAAAGTGSGTRGVQFAVNTSGLSNLVFRFDQHFSADANRFVRVEYTTDGANWTSAGILAANLGLGNTRYNNRAVDLSGVTGSANFAVRLVSVFDPNGTDYVAASSSSTYGTTGTWRFDSVTLTRGHVWTGGGADTSLATGGAGGNFGGAAAPGTTATVLFGTAAGSNTTVTTAPGGTTLDQVIFQTGAPSYTIAGDGLIVNAGIVNNATNRQTISAPVNFGYSNRIQAGNGGALTLGGSVLFTNFLVLDGAGTTALNGTVQGVTAVNPPTTGHPARPTIRVALGATLAGVGTIGSSGATNTNHVEVFAGGAIRGGDPNGSAVERVGTLTVLGNVTVNSTATTNGILRVEASRNTATTQPGNSNADSSVLSVTAGGILNLNPGSGNKFTIDLVNGPDALQLGETYIIQLAGVDAATNLQLNGSPIGGNVTIDPAHYAFTSSAFSAFNTVSLKTNSPGTGLYVTFTPVPVPEPAAVLGIAGGVLALGAWRRRRRLACRRAVISDQSPVISKQPPVTGD